ncbi:histidine phosphatase family protein [Glutamicibacter uratoxydans]|uniref:histidine phosphatase family protein n=1 Tax=Glutamicibacter uratoxydans TaxID=43667 RepID=UPI003D6EB457
MVFSLLGRAWQTAQIIADYLGFCQVLEVEDLLERDYGAAEGCYLDPLTRRNASGYWPTGNPRTMWWFVL